jgi:hypothetical protein
MGMTVGDGIVVASLAAALIAYLYFRYMVRRRRVELIHQERLVAMEKGIPLPELLIDLPSSSRLSDPRTPLIHGIVWTALGVGAMLALALLRPLPNGLWPLPIPIVSLGVGMILYYVLASRLRR